MKTIFIPDIIQQIGVYLEDYEDVKALRHTCVNAFNLKYNVGIYRPNKFEHYINSIKKI